MVKRLLFQTENKLNPYRNNEYERADLGELFFSFVFLIIILCFGFYGLFLAKKVDSIDMPTESTDLIRQLNSVQFESKQ